ncbi:hypothetical protein MASR1M8_00250 [Thermomonas brevis]
MAGMTTAFNPIGANAAAHIAAHIATFFAARDGAGIHLAGRAFHFRNLLVVADAALTPELSRAAKRRRLE